MFDLFADNQLYPRAIADPVNAAEVPLSPLEPRCCGGRLPASVVNKLNKLSARSGLIKMVGEFGLRENLYYGSIFICMTLIVIGKRNFYFKMSPLDGAIVEQNTILLVFWPNLISNFSHLSNSK